MVEWKTLTTVRLVGRGTTALCDSVKQRRIEIVLLTYLPLYTNTQHEQRQTSAVVINSVKLFKNELYVIQYVSVSWNLSMSICCICSVF